MDQTRKLWASAAVVGVIVAGGASVAAAASAGKLDQVARETRAVVEKAPSGEPQELLEGPDETPAPATTDGFIVSREINPDPEKVLEYWTDQRMEDAEPMPMPEARPDGHGSTE
ncbi:hypothetical protein ACGFJC_05975 [Nonomuraea fuscirosea]|jgi:hypothetical protein|uniref:Uncharacterized protein n=1 Tax=Nonomuraea fuscirosea TaxID=1291556 RepID=A0A2T0N567_9ACTN|nr:hypothetical protein [Nonomuraea fuscirosea]PRX67513.1 hypothetical protein B0I32_104270 [Nonomuraea fuscirosea]WSA57473.1 hypothetical protein OIE67_23510 [Nonomuraea fuscirosea]